MLKLASFFILLSYALSTPLIAQVRGLNLRKADPVPNEIEAMYDRGLDFLVKSQTNEGSWEDPHGSDPGVVGLALIAILARGTDPVHGPYSSNISRAIDFIIEQQNPANGYIGNSMYNHGFATLALAEAYGMVEHPKIANSLKRAVDLIISSQKRNSRGAWRYRPESTDHDSTVTGCQIVALYAARNAGIAIPEEVFRKALNYMNTCRDSEGAYGYTSSRRPKVTLTAIGSLCFSLAKEKDSAGYKNSLEYLRKNIEWKETHYPLYFEYYMSQALFHADEALWEEWNKANVRLLAVTQAREGNWRSNHGMTFGTSAALLSMALNYRFLPIYEK